jgi:hypothetical protein
MSSWITMQTKKTIVTDYFEAFKAKLFVDTVQTVLPLRAPKKESRATGTDLTTLFQELKTAKSYHQTSSNTEPAR